MTALLSPNAKQQFLTSAGALANGYKLYTYAAGTTTPRATYSDRAGGVPNANPIVLDARGEAVVYLTPGMVYDYVLKSGDDTTEWTRPGVAADAGDADAVGFTQAGTGAVARTLQEKVRERTSVKDYGATGDGVTDDTLAINAAIEAVGSAGGGEVFFPPGTYMVTSHTGETSADTAFGVSIQHDNVHLIGAGRGATTIRAIVDDPAHVIKIGRRVGASPNAVTNCSVRSMTVWGNRVPDTIGGDNINVSSGATGVTLEDLHIKECGHYGIGMQRDNFNDCRIRNVVIEDANGDGIDWKIDTNSTSRNNTVENVRVVRFGLDVVYGAANPQAGVDIRSGVKAKNIFCGEYVGNSAGVRVQIGVNDLITDEPVQRSSVEDVTCIASEIGTGTIGLQLGVNCVKVNGAHCGHNKWNYRIRSSLNTVENFSCAGGEQGVWVYGDASALPTDNVFVNGIVRTASTYGILLSGAAGYLPVRNLFVNVVAQDNVTANFHIAEGITGTRLVGGSVASGYTDLGTDTVTVGVQGLITPGKLGRNSTQHVSITGDSSHNILSGVSVSGAPKALLIQSDANSGDVWLRALNTGNGSAIKFGTHVASGDAAVSGYITIKDDAGTVRKLAVIT